MRFVRNLLVNTLLVVACATLIQAAGVPVANGLSWGAAQVRPVVQQVALPSWVDADPVKQITQPVRVAVAHTIAWVARLRGK